MNNSPGRQVEPASYPFARHEIARLLVYKAAIAAGLYSDASMDSSNGACPFTAAELARLAIYRAAIRAGFYTDSFTQPGEAALKSRERPSPHSLTGQHRSGSTGLHASSQAKAAIKMAKPTGQF